MMKGRWKPIVVFLGIAIVVSILLSLVWRIPYIYTFIGFAGGAFAGHLVTIDDDMPGGWSNPDGSSPSTWPELVIKAGVLSALIILASSVPGLRELGAG